MDIEMTMTPDEKFKHYINYLPSSDLLIISFSEYSENKNPFEFFPSKISIEDFLGEDAERKKMELTNHLGYLEKTLTFPLYSVEQFEEVESNKRKKKCLYDINEAKRHKVNELVEEYNSIIKTNLPSFIKMYSNLTELNNITLEPTKGTEYDKTIKIEEIQKSIKILKGIEKKYKNHQN